ncbi:MFS transporter [Luteipulveratus mongoliensis]|uniref:Major facilitator superfamily (MFS) profile domain-containing protein n=1 Tax=Luteipulveratus mongoliensis TaxID=571913 RepID=A0A0K1JE06_9MICO|nr:MFS transporter [Luteipulveratus mongoliensis]AKU14820.1 hypothetical protein VV02_01285 [Luteipulveratus mongoliensis]
MTDTVASTTVDAGTTTRWFLALTQFLLILDTALLNVAVPAIGTDLGLGATGQTWVLNAYVVAFGGLLLLSGCLADARGPGRVLIAGLLVLALGAAVGAVGQTGAIVIASRAAQGAGAALAAASAMALVFSRFTGPARGRALGLVAAMAGLGGAVGTVLGGVLTEWISWRATFWLNVIAALALAIAARWVPDLFGRGRPRTFNAVGAACMTLALAATAYAVTSTADVGWLSPQVLTSAAVAVVALLAWLRSERRPMRPPLVNPIVWRTPALLRALVLAGIGQWVLVPAFLVISLYLQHVLGYEPAAAGLGLLPMSVAICFIAPQVPRAMARWGLRMVMVGGFILVALGATWLTQISADGSFFVSVLGPTMLLALGLPTVSIATNIAVAETTPADEPGLGSGLLTTAQQLGATLGLAAWVSISAAGSPTGAVDVTQGYARAFAAGAVAMVAAAVLASRTSRLSQ